MEPMQCTRCWKTYCECGGEHVCASGCICGYDYGHTCSHQCDAVNAELMGTDADAAAAVAELIEWNADYERRTGVRKGYLFT